MSNLATPWTAAYQAPPSLGFSRQEYWSGVPFPSLTNAHFFFFFHILLYLKLECILELMVSLYLPMHLSACLSIYLSIWQPVDPYGNCLHFKVYPSPSGQFGWSAVSDSLWSHGLQHTKSPCPSPTPGACPNLCSLSQWCHPTISSSVIPLSFRLQSFPASGSFPKS